MTTQELLKIMTDLLHDKVLMNEVVVKSQPKPPRYVVRVRRRKRK